MCRQTLATMRSHLSAWWSAAQADFPGWPPAQTPLTQGLLAPTFKESGGAYLTLTGADLPDVRRSLLDSLKQQVTPLGVLDDFQVAGVFVNWWDNIKYDLKTIMASGWSTALIPDAYVVAASSGRSWRSGAAGDGRRRTGKRAGGGGHSPRRNCWTMKLTRERR